MESTVALLSLQLALLGYALVCFVLYFLAYLKIISYDRKDYFHRNVLIITAHPDDECMFFSPTLVELSRISKVHILCTTTGNYYGQGAVRKKEILHSCKILGIPKERVKVLDDSAFPDDQNASWDLKRLGEDMVSIIERIQPDFIFTFDDYGVSGHANHISVSKVVRSVLSSANYPQKLPKLYQLESVPLTRKYISLFDLPMSIFSGHLIFISTIPDVLKSQFAMYAHYSQFVWFRIVYIIFSRYMIINTFVEIS